MIQKFAYLGVVAMITAAATPAAADPAKGYRVTYVADRGHYCVRVVSENEAARLGVALYKTECHSAAAWAAMGLKVSHS